MFGTNKVQFLLSNLQGVPLKYFYIIHKGFAAIYTSSSQLVAAGRRSLERGT